MPDRVFYSVAAKSPHRPGDEPRDLEYDVRRQQEDDHVVQGLGQTGATLTQARSNLYGEA